MQWVKTFVKQGFNGVKKQLVLWEFIVCDCYKKKITVHFSQPLPVFCIYPVLARNTRHCLKILTSFWHFLKLVFLPSHQIPCLYFATMLVIGSKSTLTILSFLMKMSYSVQIRSISWLLMPWFHVSPALSIYMFTYEASWIWISISCMWVLFMNDCHKSLNFCFSILYLKKKRQETILLPRHLIPRWIKKKTTFTFSHCHSNDLQFILQIFSFIYIFFSILTFVSSVGSIFREDWCMKD